MVALQNIDNNEVICKIVQDKELRELSASSVGFRRSGDAGTIGEKLLSLIVQERGDIFCKHLRCGQLAPAVRPTARSSLA
jgi:hypothetical protein